MTANKLRGSTKHAVRGSLLLLLFVVAWERVATFRVQAFSAIPKSSTWLQRKKLNDQQRAVAVRGVVDDESSEWYSPPPPRPKPAALKPTGAKALQMEIATAQELDELLNDSNDQRLVIVKFYASWCKSCAKFGMKMDKLAAEHADWVQKSDVGGDVIQKRGSLRIVNVEYGAARELCTELQIARLPTLHLYMPGAETTAKTNTATTMQRVQDFVCPPSEFHRLQDLTAFYLKKQKQQQTAVIDPTVTCSRGPVPTAMNLQSANDAFEAKLDAGRNLIREKLAAQLPAVAAKLYAAGAATKDEEDGKADNKPRTKSGFWNRFRKSKASNNTSDVA